MTALCSALVFAVVHIGRSAHAEVLVSRVFPRLFMFTCPSMHVCSSSDDMPVCICMPATWQRHKLALQISQQPQSGQQFSVVNSHEASITCLPRSMDHAAMQFSQHKQTACETYAPPRKSHHRQWEEEHICKVYMTHEAPASPPMLAIRHGWLKQAQHMSTSILR